MKLKKILSMAMAAAIGVSMISTIPTSAATNETGTADKWGTVNYNFNLNELTNDDAIYVNAYYKGTEANKYPTLVAMASDSDTDWGNSCWLTYPISESATSASPQKIAVLVSDLRNKYISVTEHDFTASTSFRLTYWNDGASDTKVTIDAMPKTDVWVSNDDGSYTLTRGSAETIPALSLNPSSGVKGQTFKANVTVEGNSGDQIALVGNLGANWTNFDTERGSKNISYTFTDSFSDLAFQVWYAAEGDVITVSDIELEKVAITLSNGNKVFWKSAVENDKYSYRAAYVCKKSELAGKKSLKFTFNTTGKTVSGTATKYYAGIADSSTETYALADSDLVVITYVLKNIPSDVTVNNFTTAWEK